MASVLCLNLGSVAFQLPPDELSVLVEEALPGAG